MRTRRHVGETAAQPLWTVDRRAPFTHLDVLPLLRRITRIKLASTDGMPPFCFVDNDRALEWAENRLPEHACPGRAAELLCTSGEGEILAGLNGDELRVLTDRMQRRCFSRGEVIIPTGDRADALHFLVRGHASAHLETHGDRRRRLAAFSPVMPFGEMAVIERGTRSATVVADTDVGCDVLSVDDLDDLTECQPPIVDRRRHNLCRELSRKLRKANCERAIFDA